MMYQVLEKDIIENEIVPNLPTPKRGFPPRVTLAEIANCILYKLKTGVHWKYLHVKSFFEDKILSYNHNDLYDVESYFDQITQTLEKANIAIEGLFVNADAGFDSGNFRKHCESKDIIPNIAFNKRNGTDTENCYFDEILYREKYAIERTNA